MTISSETKKVTADGNASATSFSFSPLVLTVSSDLLVTHVDASGVETVLSEGTGSSNYTVVVGSYPGTGSITYPSDEVTPLPSGESLVMEYNYPLKQETDLGNQGGYNPETLEHALDRLNVQDLQQQALHDRTFKAPTSDETVTDFDIQSMTAGGYLRLAADGTSASFASISTASASASDSTPQDIVANGGGAAAGSSADFSRRDHVHQLPTLASLGVAALASAQTFTARQMWSKGGDIASANPLVIDTDGNYFDVTGTTNFASMTVPAGMLFALQFDGALTMTHHASNLNLPGGADITTAAGDRMICFATGSNTVHVLSYVRANEIHTIAVPASAMIVPDTNGAASGNVELTTNDVQIATKDFDQTTQEHAQFTVPMPKGWNRGTVTFDVGWSHASGASFGVVWELAGVAFGDSDAMDASWGTAVEVSDTGGTNNDLFITSNSSAVTIAGTPAAEDLAHFRISRDPANASDNLDADARLHFVRIFYTVENSWDN